MLAALRPLLRQSFREPPEHELEAPAIGLGASENEGDRVRALLAEKLGPAPVDVDELIRQCGASAAAVLMVILELERAGQVQRQPRNRISWR